MKISNIIVVILLLFFFKNTFRKEKYKGSPFFQDNYEDSKSIFNHYAKIYGKNFKNLEVKTFMIDDSECTVVIINKHLIKDKKSLLLHISGTHGIEGYVGSAIQSYYLSLTQIHSVPMIFVHGLNPFGLRHYRRVNEKNVDLNRNALFSKKDWNFVKNLTNINHDYNKLYQVFNPTTKLDWWSRLHNLFNAIKKISILGIGPIKRAMVTGTYQKEQERGIFYGGHELQKSHIHLSLLLKGFRVLDHVEKLVLIDVHSGLGPMGDDTLMVSDKTTITSEVMNKIYNGYYKMSMTHGGSDGATSGYELTKGDVADNYPKLFNNLIDTISITQEFGTYHSIHIGIGLIEENQWWQTKNSSQINKSLYELFCPRNMIFHGKVLKRGLMVIEQSINYLENI